LPGHAKWHHPAGWIDKGENLIDAVIREAKEETGFEFTPTYLIGIYSLYREDFNLHPIKFIFAGTVPDMPSDSFNPDEILEIKFFFLKKSTTWTTKCFSMLMRSKLSKIIFPERSIHWK
jgi:8-oxo-dGTP pyrophosphatase MutT (NUDIX family)